MTNDNREFRPERFVSNGDEEFQQDWEILESEENSEEDQAFKDESADAKEEQKKHGPATSALLDVASRYGFGKKKPTDE